MVEGIFQSAPGAPLPAILVAHAGDRALGTVALRPWFAEEPMPETPWVRQLFVFPAYRGRGVDRQLISAIEDRARGLGYSRLYAATNRIERLLARRGWQAFSSAAHEDGPLVWMRKAI